MASFIKKDENLIYIAALSVFLPYYLSAAVLVGLAIYILIAKQPLKTVFNHSGSYAMLAFSLLTVIVALIHKNYFGLIGSVACFLIVILGFYFTTIMTSDTFEKALDICCLPPAIILPIIVIEKIIFFDSEWHRCCGDLFDNMYTSIFFHPNYLGGIMAAVVLICAYKVIIKRLSNKFYYFVAFICLIIIYLTESMFACVEVFIGLAALLFIANRHTLLAFLFIAATFFCAIVYIVPDVFPRILQADGTFANRLLIWSLTLERIPQSFWFGHGFFAYFKICMETPGAYYTTHAHNLILEPVLSFGVVGSLLLFILCFLLLQKLFVCKGLLRKSSVTQLILPLITAVTIHSIIDMTMFWHQNAVLYAIILAGYGADQKKIQKIFKKRKENLI